jgi:hypothetical protein
VNFQKKGLLTALLLSLAAGGAQAQITNDTTVQLYGPKTTRVFFERDFFRGNYTESAVDTSITNIYSPFYWFQDTVFQQTIGNIGLATRPLPILVSQQIGARPGRNSFDLYAYRSEKILYYDTRSPFTKLNYIQGSIGEGLFEVEFSRNIKKWWNAGISYNRILTDKQIGATSRRDGQVDLNNFQFYTHVQSTNNRYHLFGNYTHMNNKFVETGGIKPQAGDVVPDDLFDYLSESVNLTQATGRETRHAFHIGQTFALFGDHLKLYHELDQKRQFNRFDDNLLKFKNTDTAGHTTGLLYYPDKRNSNLTQTHDRTTYSELQNAFGITGNQQHYYYKAYLKYRDATWEIYKPPIIYQNGDIPFTRNFMQIFAGGELEGRLNKKIYGTFKAEYKPTDEYVTEGELRFLFLKFRQTRISAAPGLMQQTYFGNSYNWHNGFENTTTDRSAFQLQVEKWHNRIRLEFAVTSFSNYVFFNQMQEPEQVSGTQRLLITSLDHALTFGKLHWDNVAVYSNNNDAEKIRLPELLLNSKLYFQGFIFKKALFGQFGLETTFRSGYFADAYSPALNQFYLQDAFEVEPYPIVDVFLAVDIKSLNVFLKLAHANEGFPEPGYFTTPYYTGMRRSFLFGVKWMFFD